MIKVSTSLKNKDLTPRGIAKLGQIYVPIAIRRHNDVTVFSAIQQQKLLSEGAKKRTMPISGQQKEMILRDFPELSSIITENKGIILITEYDTTSEAHVKSVEEFVGLKQDLDIIQFFDFNYKDNEGNDLWVGWDIEKDNYAQFAKKIKNICLIDEDIMVYKSEIDKIKKREKTIAQMEIEIIQWIVDAIDEEEKNITIETDVSAIEKEYNALEDYQKDLVNNYFKIEIIKNKIAELNSNLGFVEEVIIKEAIVEGVVIDEPKPKTKRTK